MIPLQPTNRRCDTPPPDSPMRAYGVLISLGLLVLVAGCAEIKSHRRQSRCHKC